MNVYMPTMMDAYYMPPLMGDEPDDDDDDARTVYCPHETAHLTLEDWAHYLSTLPYVD